MTLIEIRPHRWGWKAFEAPGVEPVFPTKDGAIDYAQQRACFRSGEIQILDSIGNVERVMLLAALGAAAWIIFAAATKHDVSVLLVGISGILFGVLIAFLTRWITQRF